MIAHIHSVHMTMKARFNVGESPFSLFFAIYSGGTEG